MTGQELWMVLTAHGHDVPLHVCTCIAKRATKTGRVYLTTRNGLFSHTVPTDAYGQVVQLIRDGEVVGAGTDKRLMERCIASMLSVDKAIVEYYL